MSNFGWFKIFGALLASSSLGFGAVSGKVIDNQGQEIEGAKVLLLQKGLEQYTSVQGEFFIGDEVTRYSTLKFNSPHQLNILAQGFSLYSKIPLKNIRVFIHDLQGRLIFKKQINNSSLKNEISVLFNEKIQNTPGNLYLSIQSEEFSTFKKLAPLGIRGEASYAVYNKTLLSLVSAQDAIDTLVISKQGYLSSFNFIDSYDFNFGDIVLESTSLPANSFFRVEINNSQSRLPYFVESFITVTDSLNLGVNGLEDCWNLGKCKASVDNIEIGNEGDLSVKPILGYEYSSPTILLIDISTSINSTQLNSVIAGAKSFVKKNAIHSPVAIYGFSSETKVFNDFTQDTTVLFSSLNTMQTIGPYGSSTKLWGALDTALSVVQDEFNFNDKLIKNSQIVVFTDGTDTEGSTTFSQVLSRQGEGKAQKDIWFLLGNWNSFDKSEIEQLSGLRVYLAQNKDSIQGGFDWIDHQINQLAQSTYLVQYSASQRGDVEHLFTFEVSSNQNSGIDASDSIAFNSKDFVDGYAPYVENLRVELEGDSLVAKYDFVDPEGLPEGNSKYSWSKSLFPLSGNFDSIPEAAGKRNFNGLALESGAAYRFFIEPAQFIGTPAFGLLDSIDYQMDSQPSTHTRKVSGQPLQGDTLKAEYGYYDADGDLEGDTEFQWYYYNFATYLYVEIAGATDSIYVLTEADRGRTLGFAVKPVAQSGYFKDSAGFAKYHMANGDFVKGWNAPEITSTSINGNFNEGAELTLSYTYLDDEGDPESGTTIQWYRDSLPIIGADSLNYKIGSLDENVELYAAIVPKTNAQVPQVGDTVWTAKYRVNGCVNGRFVDQRDSTSYTCTNINGKYWMSDDLKYAASGTKCYNNDANYCTNVGRLYPVGTDDDVCPDNWTIATKDDWQAMLDYTGQTHGDTTKEISIDPDGWPDRLKYRVARFVKAKSGWVQSTDWDKVVIPSFEDSVNYPSGNDTLGLNLYPNGSSGYSTYSGYGGSSIVDKFGQTVEGPFAVSNYWQGDGAYYVNVSMSGWVTTNRRFLTATSYYHIRCVQPK